MLLMVPISNFIQDIRVAIKRHQIRNINDFGPNSTSPTAQLTWYKVHEVIRYDCMIIHFHNQSITKVPHIQGDDDVSFSKSTFQSTRCTYGGELQEILSENFICYRLPSLPQWVRGYTGILRKFDKLAVAC